MRLRPYRKHEDDARLLDLIQNHSNDITPFGISKDDSKLFAKQRLIQDLDKGLNIESDTIIVAVADSDKEVETILQEPKQQTIDKSGSNDSQETSPHSSQSKSRIVAFIKLAIQPDIDTGRPAGYIRNLCVDKRFESSEAITLLIDYAKHWAQRNGIFKLELDINSTDGKAIAVYEESGFHISAVRMEISCAQPE